PGYGLVQPVELYQSKRFICAGLTESATAWGPVSSGCAVFLYQVAQASATDCSAAGTARSLAGLGTVSGLPSAASALAMALDAAVVWLVIPGTPRVSGIWFGTVVYGASSGVLVNALYMGTAARSIWFMGWAPRICSIVLTTLICE